MPRFFFDLHEGETVNPDDIGVDFPKVDEAVAECCRTLGEIAKDQLARTCAMEELAVVLRDEQGSPLVRVALNFQIVPVQ